MLERAARLRYLLAGILVVTIPQQWIFSKRLECLPLVVSAEANAVEQQNRCSEPVETTQRSCRWSIRL
uniref:Secreted protein n=1 Tax=Ascaris lumbricoides TaxID=6252 RepID=A0A0M3HFW2_ASCLU